MTTAEMRSYGLLPLVNTGAASSTDPMPQQQLQPEEGPALEIDPYMVCAASGSDEYNDDPVFPSSWYQQLENEDGGKEGQREEKRDDLVETEHAMKGSKVKKVKGDDNMKRNTKSKKGKTAKKGNMTKNYEDAKKDNGVECASRQEWETSQMTRVKYKPTRMRILFQTKKFMLNVLKLITE